MTNINYHKVFVEARKENTLFLLMILTIFSLPLFLLLFGTKSDVHGTGLSCYTKDDKTEVFLSAENYSSEKGIYFENSEGDSLMYWSPEDDSSGTSVLFEDYTIINLSQTIESSDAETLAEFNNRQDDPIIGKRLIVDDNLLSITGIETQEDGAAITVKIANDYEAQTDCQVID